MKGIVAYNLKSEYHSLVFTDNVVGDRGFPLPPYHLAHSVRALWGFLYIKSLVSSLSVRIRFIWSIILVLSAS